MSKNTLMAAGLLVFSAILALPAFAQVAKDTRSTKSDPQKSELSHQIDIPAGTLADALDKLVTQAGVQILYEPMLADGVKVQGLSGSLTFAVALGRILANTGLKADSIDGKTVVLKRANSSTANDMLDGQMRVALGESGKDAKSTGASNKELEDLDAKGIPEILVKDSRSLNVDIQRTEDAPQPYVIFDRDEIQRSQTVNLEEFLRTRLPMNTASASFGQSAGQSRNTSSINLRGLGENQTLILVDGRRMPGITLAGTPYQPDLNGIPLSAVERIEVLPSTAGGIYGGSATGGMVNIILRRDYRGLEAKAVYGNTFDTDTGNVRFDLSGGFDLEGGRTQVMLTASHSEANNLRLGDRDFAARSTALQRANNPNVATWTTSAFPPAGATVNIRSADGSPLVLDQQYGSRALVSSATGQPTNITHIPLGYAGAGSDAGQALLNRAGSYNLDTPNDLVGLQLGLVSAPTTDSTSLNVRREFGRRLEAFVDVSKLVSQGSSFNAAIPTIVVNLPASAPNNPFQQAINVRFPAPGVSFDSRSKSTTLRGTVGLIARLPHQWMGEVDYGWSRSRYAARGLVAALDTAGSTSLNTGLPAPDGRPALNVLQEGNTYPIDWSPYWLPIPNYFNGPYDTILKDAMLRLSGPTLQMPGGALSLSALVERREEEMKDSFLQSINTTTREPTYTFFPHRSQTVDSYYVEARAPLVSRKNAKPGMREVELQLSVRRDEYLTRSVPASANAAVPSRDGPFPVFSYTTSRLASTDYTLGLRYMPLRDVTLRASFGTGFLPPSIIQTAPRIQSSTSSLGNDPKRGGTPMYVGVPYTLISAGNPDLRPEESESWSAGLIFTPEWAPNFRLSVDYSRIEKIDEIQTTFAQYILDNEDLFPGRVVRGAKLTGDPASWAGPITSFDSSPTNIASTALQAYDIQADYSLQTQRLGEFRWNAVVTWEPHYRSQTTPGDPVLDRVGFNGGPLEWRGNLGLNWEKGALALGWNAQYYNPYKIYMVTASAASRAESVLNQGSVWVPRQVYHDLIATYRFDEGSGFAGSVLAGSEVSVGIQNVFDTSPPILVTTTPFGSGSYSTYGDPRLRRYSISVRKQFGR